MTHAVLNDLILTVALLLECGLLALLFAHRLARKLPVFTALLGFYLLRSTLLLALFGHIDQAGYASAFESMSVVDLLLQGSLAIEIAIGLTRPMGASAPLGRVLLLPPAIALAATALLTWILPTNSPTPFDRVQDFDWMWIIALGCWAFTLSARAHDEQPMPRRIALGFAFYGFAGIVATSARTLAALHRDARSFAAWSYVLPAVWVLVVIYWSTAPNRTVPEATHQLWLSSRRGAEGSASS